jgi:hypothetical protein
MGRPATDIEVADELRDCVQSRVQRRRISTAVTHKERCESILRSGTREMRILGAESRSVIQPIRNTSK